MPPCHWVLNKLRLRKLAQLLALAAVTTAQEDGAPFLVTLHEKIFVKCKIGPEELLACPN